MGYDRPYLSYGEQIQKLKDKNIIITDDEFVLKALRTHSYYILLNGYKDLFDSELLKAVPSNTLTEDDFLQNIGKKIYLQ